MDETQKEQIQSAVREKYGYLANKQLEQPVQACGCGANSSCCAGETGLAETAADLYTGAQISDLPDSVTGIALGCGNPTAISELQEGETVLDLGSGGGIDCFLAAKRVGPSGHVIGLDMTTRMLDLARANAKKQNIKNVEFRYGYIEDIPLPDESVDVIISNCVINLSGEKDAVFKEAFRVLKPGGRLNVSDIVTVGEMPKGLARQLSAWAGCVSGALEEGLYLSKIKEAGFSRTDVVSRKFYTTEMMMQDEAIQELVAGKQVALADLDQRIASITLKAYKTQK
jgi:ubiquinone/menaquinone biosynthesis C-methylase UbiE